MKLKKPGGKGDSPPLLSHEFIIKNHADIISCVCMVAFGMLLFQATSSIGSQIIFVHYNETREDNSTSTDAPTKRILDKFVETLYRRGPKDAINVMFYGLVWMVLHAVAQEYLWERTAKKLHLSKLKNSKYFDSGFHVLFYLLSVVWGCSLFSREGLLSNWTGLWEGYPHELMGFSVKFFMLSQMSYWLHCYPELYFMKARKEDLFTKTLFYTVMLALVCGAYVGRLQRLALVLLVTHYLVEFTFHCSRLLHYHRMETIASKGFHIWQVLTIVVRILSILVSVVTLCFGLQKLNLHDDSDTIPFYCTTSFRFSSLAAILLFQVVAGWNFVSYLLSRADQSPAIKGPGKSSNAKTLEKKKKK